MAQMIGTVAKLTGVAYARGEDGKLRELQIGDEVFQGEVLVTARGSVIQVDVPDAPAIVVPGEREVLLNGEVTYAERDTADESVLEQETLDDLVAALEGDGDLIDSLGENTAPAAGAVGNEGSSFIRLGRIGYGLQELGPLLDGSDAAGLGGDETDFDADLQLLVEDEVEVTQPNLGPDAIDDAVGTASVSRSQ